MIRVPFFLLFGFSKGALKQKGQKGTTQGPSCSRLLGKSTGILSIQVPPNGPCLRGEMLQKPHRRGPVMCSSLAPS